MTRTIIIAARVDEVIIVTPRSPDAARGQLADRILVLDSMHDNPATPDLIAAAAPALVTRPARPGFSGRGRPHPAPTSHFHAQSPDIPEEKA